MRPVHRALLSVSDKAGLVEFAQCLARHGVELVSTGGTARALRAAGLAVIDVADVTGFPEMMDGRVKTLHPLVHGAILARRGHAGDRAELAAHGITAIDLVVVNLYPFEATVAQPGVTASDAVEKIDIGGPTMVRAAAKNHADVAVVTDPADYPKVAAALDAQDGALGLSLRSELAAAAFLHTARYDAAVATWLGAKVEEAATPEAEHITPPLWGGPMVRSAELRYGENPHQSAGLYVEPGLPQALARADQLQGKALSYNNWMDMDGAYEVARDLGPTGLAIVKHTNPCGAARSDESLLDAYHKARACDPVSAFGGIVATAGVIDAAVAAELAETFLEVILAADVTPEARELLSRKKRLRVLTLDAEGWTAEMAHATWQPRPIAGGMLVQAPDGLDQAVRNLRVVTKRQPTDDEWAALEFGWTVVRHVKSNAIVFSHADRTAAVGAGQMSRVDAVRIAVLKATASLEGTICASDAFFPFADGVQSASEAGATAVIQPGGSIRDDEVIAAADALGLAMVFSGRRHFKH